MATSNCDERALVAAYEAAKQALDFEPLWEAVEALDLKIPSAAQMALFRRLVAGLRGATFWLARQAGREDLDVAELVARYAPGFKSLHGLLPDILSKAERAAVDRQMGLLLELGAPEDMARAAAVIGPLTSAADFVDLAEGSSWPLANVARLYYATGAAFAFDRLRAAAGGVHGWRLLRTHRGPPAAGGPAGRAGAAHPGDHGLRRRRSGRRRPRPRPRRRGLLDRPCAGSRRPRRAGPSRRSRRPAAPGPSPS
jgi:hypothetical protein